MDLLSCIATILLLCAPAVLIVWSSKRWPAFRGDGLAMVAGAWIILATLYPYWIFGSYSAIGWYDEYDAVIPAYLLRVASASPVDFSHGFAGGTRVDAAFPDLASGYVDLYRSLLQWFDPAFASFIFRFLGTFLLYAGLFLTARRTLRASVRASSIASLAGVFASAYPYAWVLGGYGWNLTLMVWAPLLLLVDVRPAARLALGLVYGLVAASTITIGFFAPTVTLYCFVAVVFLRRPLWSTASKNLPIILLIGVLLILNNIPGLSLLLQSWGESSRFLRVTGPHALEALFSGVTADSSSLGEALASSWNVLSLTLLRGLEVLTGQRIFRGFPFTIFFTSLTMAAAVGLALVRRSLRYPLALLLPAAGIALMTFAGAAYRLPVISSYRWDILYLCLPFIATLVLAELMDVTDTSDRLAKLASRGVAVTLLAFVLISAGGLAQRSVSDLHRYGGWAALSHYSALARLAQDEPLTRAGSLPAYRPKPYIGPAYGLDVIDGVRRKFTWRRVAFWFESLPKEPIAGWHTHRHTLGKQLDQLDLRALRLTNTGILLSTRRLESPALTEVLAVDRLRLKDLRSTYHRMLAMVMPTVRLAPPIYAYRLDGEWQRVFTPAEFRQVDVNDFDLSYFGMLPELPRHALLIARNAPRWLRSAGQGALEVTRVSKTRQGIEVSTNGQDGYVAYNQEFTRDWSAVCDGRSLDLYPVNAIQMVAAVPKGCTQVSFVHGLRYRS